MANEWVVAKDKQAYGKRYLEIVDTVNKMSYGSYFPLSATDAVIKGRFKEMARERRQEIGKRVSKLNLATFEAEI